MKWKKLGHVFVADHHSRWAQWGAFLPTAERQGDRIRVYVAMYDQDTVGRIGYVDVASTDPTKVIEVSPVPVLDIGQPGTFDDNGVTPASIVNYDGVKYLYYVGWQKGVKMRYYLFSGLAVSHDEGEYFHRVSEAPILDRRDSELFVRTAPSVICDCGLWKMWYVAGDKWINLNGKQVPTYKMRYIESEDGFVWRGSGAFCLNHWKSDEFGYGRPQVIKEDGIYKMFYSIRYRSKGYRLGYAESKKGTTTWIRKDEQIGIDVSESGWDSESLSFASIVDCEDKRYMFYNGSHAGRTGFGVAALEEE
jgi:hypothetical protein